MILEQTVRRVVGTGRICKCLRCLHRGLASLLALCMLFTLLPAAALAEELGGQSVAVAAFAPLEEPAFTVPWGTAEDDLALPETLDAWVLQETAIQPETPTEPEQPMAPPVEQESSDPETETVEIQEEAPPLAEEPAWEPVTVEGVAWSCPDYDGAAAGAYVFTASAAGYVCAEGVEWPVVTVTVEDAPQPAPSAYDAALALFAALPQPAAVAGMTDNEKDALAAQLADATDALFALPDEDYARFLAEHAAYLETVAALQDALTGGVETLALGDDTPDVSTKDKAIYAKGIAISLTEETQNLTIVKYDSNNDGEPDTKLVVGGLTINPNGYDLSGYTIYGGTKTGDMTGDTKITMTGGKVYNVIGGSNGGTITGNTSITIGGSACVGYSVDGNGGGTVTGTASVTIGGSAVIGTEGNTDAHINGGSGAVKGGTTVTIEGNAAIYGSVYGGYGGMNGYNVTVEGGTAVNITGGTIAGSVYGGGGSSIVSATVTGDTKVTITGGTVNGSVYGGGNGSSYYDATVTGNTSVNISGGEVKGSVYGGGNEVSAAVTGNTTVTITGGAVCASGGRDTNVYGGGKNGAVGGNATVNISGVTVGKAGGNNTSHVAGGGYAGPVTGGTSVTISGGAVITGGVVGGGGGGQNADGAYTATVGQGASVVVRDSAKVGSDVMGGGPAGVTGDVRVTVGGGVQIGSGSGGGIIIQGAKIPGGVATFAIDPALTEAASVYVNLQADFQSGTKIATGAAAGDVARIKLVGDAVTTNPNLKAVLQGTDIVVNDHTHSWSTAWSYDSTHHWHECTAGGCPLTDSDKAQKGSYGAHNYTTTPATCTKAAECVCGKTSGAALGHSLTYSVSGAVVTEDCTRNHDHTATATLGFTNNSASGLTYTGSPLTPAAAVTYGDGWAGEKPQTVAYENNTNAGTATAKATIGGQTASLNFTIARVGNAITDLTCADVVFGGMPSPHASANFGTPTYTYSSERNGAYGEWQTTNGVGKWWVTATVAATDNYGSASAYMSFQVTAAPMTGITAADYSGTYDGAAHGITVNSVPADATVYYSLTNNGSDWSTTRPEIKDATPNGGATVYYKVTKANYADVTGSATVRITPKEVALSWTGAGESTYDGQPRSVTATATGLVGGDSCTVTVEDGGKTDAGTHTARATGLSNGNYKLPASGTTQDYTIKPAVLTVRVADSLTISKTYNGGTDVESADVTNGLVITGLQNVETATASGTWAYADAHAGTGKAVTVTGVSISYNGTAKAGNYNFTAQDLSTTGEITRKSITPTIAFTGGPWAYNGGAIEPTYTVKDGGTELDTGDYAAAFSDNVDAGTGRLTITANADGNYSFTNAEQTFTISPREIAAVWGDVTSWEYDGQPHAPAATATGVDGETVTLDVTGGQKDHSANPYTATAVISSVTGGQGKASNYTLTSTTKDFTITQKEVGLDWSGHESLVYTGSPVNVTAEATGLVEGDACVVTVEDGDKIDAGTYTARATALSNDNYKLPDTKNQGYTIAKAPVSFAVAGNAYDYDRSAKTATVTQTANETPSVAGQFTVGYRQNGSVVDAPTVVGEYEIWVTLDSGNFKFGGEQDATRSKQVGTLTISGSAYPEQDKITWPTAEELTYGNPLSASALTGGSTTSAGGDGAFAWKELGTIPTVTNDGYTVVFTPSDTNYSTVERTVSITVKPKELTISDAAAMDRDYVPDNKAVTVSGGALEGVVSRNGVADDVALDAGKAAGTVETPDAGNDKAVTVTGYALMGADGGNYTLKQPEDVTVTIAPAQGSGSVTMAGWTYGETAKSPDPLSATNGAEHVTYRYTGTKLNSTNYDSENVPTNAGTYTVTATFAATQNYQAVTATADFTIDPKPIMVQWRETSHTYDGGAKSPTLTLVGAETADQSGVTAVLSGGGKTDAGSYPVAAQLTGDRAFNYTLTNPAGTLLIQKVPVIFTVSDDTVAHDGAAKTAAVTATPNVAHTIVYKNSAGEIVASPTEAGNYEIWAALDNLNYRHADSTGGESRRIGVLTIYQSAPPAKYAVSFAPGEGEGITGAAEPLAEALPGTLRVLPACGFTRDGWAFTGWALDGRLYQPGETVEQPARGLSFAAQWAQVVHEIGGVVDQDGNPVEHAVVTLMRGSRYAAETTTDQNGKFTFSNVAPGLYNLVGSYNGVVMTIKVLVETEDVEDAELHLPKGKTNSVVEVLAGTPEIVVGNLETIFETTDDTVFTQADADVVAGGGTVEIKLTAQAVAANADDDQQAAIEEKTQNVGLYLDLSLKKTVTAADSTSPTTSALPTSGAVLLESIVPLPAELQGKYRYAVHRLHDPDGPEGPEQPTLDTLTETHNQAGEYIEVSEDKTILTIHAKDYSLYAVAWENRPSSGNSGSGGGTAAGSLTVEDAEHGRVEVRPERPAKGQKVVITPIPDEGYQVGTVTVTDKSGKALAVTDNGDGTWTYTQPAGSVTITVTFDPASGQRPAWNPFTDVAADDWFHDSVRYVYENGLMVGTSSDKFSPHRDTSRGMIVTILWRLEGSPKVDYRLEFPDVAADAYYTEAVRWAASGGIVTGYSSGKFGPNDPITREQLAAILYRYTGSPAAPNLILEFTDADKVSAYAQDALRWAVERGIISGKGNGILDPQGQATRAQAAQMLMNFLKNK